MTASAARGSAQARPRRPPERAPRCRPAVRSTALFVKAAPVAAAPCVRPSGRRAATSANRPRAAASKAICVLRTPIAVAAIRLSSPLFRAPGSSSAWLFLDILSLAPARIRRRRTAQPARAVATLASPRATFATTRATAVVRSTRPATIAVPAPPERTAAGSTAPAYHAATRSPPA